MNWFKQWFDSPLYEKLYANRDEAEAACLGRLIEQIIPVDEFPEILDLGCGRGRHSLYFAQQGYTVTGIDLSEEAIDTARRKTEKLKLDNISFQIRDMRHPLNGKKFDAIINLFTTFGYYDNDTENMKVLDAQNAMVRKGGKIIIDFMNARKVRADFEPHSEGAFDGIEYKIKRQVEGDVIKKEIEFSGPKLDGSKNYIERVKLYEPQWFVSELTKRGFQVEQTMGNYKGADFEETVSERFIVVAVKK